MRNKFPGICYRCGNFVEARAGHFERVGRDQRKKWPNAVHPGRWLLQHAECAIKYRGTDVHYKYAPDLYLDVLEKCDQHYTLTAQLPTSLRLGHEDFHRLQEHAKKHLVFAEQSGRLRTMNTPFGELRIIIDGRNRKPSVG